MVEAKDFIINIVETPVNDEESSQKTSNAKSAKEKDLDIDWIINHALQVKFEKQNGDLLNSIRRFVTTCRSMTCLLVAWISWASMRSIARLQTLAKYANQFISLILLRIVIFLRFLDLKQSVQITQRIRLLQANEVKQ